MGAFVSHSFAQPCAIYAELLTHVLRVIQRVITTHLIDQAGIERSNAATGAVTVRFMLMVESAVGFHLQSHAAIISTSNRFVYTSGTERFLGIRPYG